jgi:hypothetical protein
LRGFGDSSNDDFLDATGELENNVTVFDSPESWRVWHSVWDWDVAVDGRVVVVSHL